MYLPSMARRIGKQHMVGGGQFEEKFDQEFYMFLQLDIRTIYELAIHRQYQHTAFVSSASAVWKLKDRDNLANDREGLSRRQPINQ